MNSRCQPNPARVNNSGSSRCVLWQHRSSMRIPFRSRSCGSKFGTSARAYPCPPILFFLRFTQLHRKLYKCTALHSYHSLAVHFATFAGCDFSSHLNRSPSSSRHSERLRIVRIVGEERMRKREGRSGCGRLVDGLHRHRRDCCGACPWSTVAPYGSDDMLMTSSRYLPTSRVVNPCQI